MDLLPLVEIIVDARFTTYTYDVQFRDICHKVAMLLYGKTYAHSVTGTLGSKGQLLITKNGLTQSKFVIVLPASDPVSKKETGKHHLSYSRSIGEMERDLASMVKHASSHGVDIRIR